VKPISECLISGCGLRVGYDHEGRHICWFHADQQKLPAHAQWKREHAVWLREHVDDLSRATTKRDNYGVLGHP
jgi:hypothetical protein